MDDIDIIRLSVPGTLLFRDVVLRVVASTCRLARAEALKKQDPSRTAHDPDFDDMVVSAVGEAFNNVAIHAYRGNTRGTIGIELELHADKITIRLSDTGSGFDLSTQPLPDLAALPERNMGLFVMRVSMDKVSYTRGNPPSVPNVLTLTKRYGPSTGPGPVHEERSDRQRSPSATTESE